MDGSSDLGQSNPIPRANTNPAWSKYFEPGGGVPLSAAARDAQKPMTAGPQRVDKWTPRHKVRKAMQENLQSDAPTVNSPSRATTARVPSESMRVETAQPTRVNTALTEADILQIQEQQIQAFQDVQQVQKKLQEQLKHRRFFRVEETGKSSMGMDRAAFAKTLTRYGLTLDPSEADCLFSFYDKDGGGHLDYTEFMQGVRGSEFVQTSRSYGFETPDPGYHDEDPDGGLSHFITMEQAMPQQTARSAKAWQQQRATDTCPFGTDRRLFGGRWQYRTSSLSKAEPVVAPRYGKTSFPARKTVSDIVTVIAEKLDERSKSSLAFQQMFNHFDGDKNGTIDKTEFESMLDVYNISLNDEEINSLFDHFGSTDGGIRYLDFVHTVEEHHKKHPLGGYAGAGDKR